ncbi:histone PARylation factor 1 [Calliopsis andreniformis]|uniref:histone PARylation factor 1 n=1 Tax=Calliopsis andreniformis TaxID=337506 RepID=UPI003FCC2E52
MSDNEDDEFKAYQEDKRLPCRYGAKCYQKNAVHHEKYKHPFTKDAKNKKGLKRTTIGKKRKKKDADHTSNDSPQKKVQKKDDNVVNENVEDKSSSYAHDNDNEKSKETNAEIKNETSDSENTEQIKDSTNEVTVASILKDSNVNIENDKILSTNAQTVISHLFLTEMPDDFFEFYEFCKNICKEDPLNALKDLQLHLVGPYDVFKDKFLSSKVSDKEALLRHWRYYYDPPEFQTIIKIDNKDGLHFGYWRDDMSEKPVFVAKNKASINCIIEPVAENIFGAVDTYMGEKLKLATPFEKTRIAQIQQKLKNYAKEKKITLDKKTSNMQTREKKVVARTFHKAGIVVPYNKKTELGYRDLAVTDNELHKLLKNIEESPSEAKKTSIVKLEEVIRLATIAADECDFGTCLELGHDLFSSGVSSVENKALNMLSLAYNLLQRPQLLEIAKAHLKNRRKSLNPSVLR